MYNSTMKFLDSAEAKQLRAVAALSDGNPFLPERTEHERTALGSAFVPSAQVWHADAELTGMIPNLQGLVQLMEELAPRLRQRLADGAKARKAELMDYEALVRNLLYMRYEPEFFALIQAAGEGRSTTGRLSGWKTFVRDVAHFLEIKGVRMPVQSPPAHLFAWGYQIRRAFHHTFRQIHGGSMPAARLRAAVWQSVFTHDYQRYRRGLDRYMADIPTLITGASGTGKELVARAIGLSRYIPFDEKSQSFRQELAGTFYAVNLSALSPTLIESELFGHCRGSFTGATADRVGWLESCPEGGTVFLDEIGELDASIQVKLLRVLQSRSFQRIGETDDRVFRGKIVAATHRDLSREMQEGRLRPDFYYRLCADRIHTPTLREQLDDSPGDLRNLLVILAKRTVGPEEADALAREVESWIATHLGSDHPWEGNVRELEQCVRSVLVRGEYLPPARMAAPGTDALDKALSGCELTADELVRRYCANVYRRTGSYEEAARRLALDRRTVKAKVDSQGN